MIILLFGVSCVGKTTVGKELAEKLQWPFFDLDEVIKKRMNTTLDQFMRDYPFAHERFRLKGVILSELINEQQSHAVIAVCPIYYARNFNSLLKSDRILAIDLQDSAENIFDRLVFSDKNDNVYQDEEYKKLHRDYFIKEILKDIALVKRVYSKVERKYFIDNQPVQKVVDDLLRMIPESTVN